MDGTGKLSEESKTIYLNTINELFGYRDDPEFSDAAMFLTLCITGDLENV